MAWRDAWVEEEDGSFGGIWRATEAILQAGVNASGKRAGSDYGLKPLHQSMVGWNAFSCLDTQRSTKVD